MQFFLLQTSDMHIYNLFTIGNLHIIMFEMNDWNINQGYTTDTLYYSYIATQIESTGCKRKREYLIKR